MKRHVQTEGVRRWAGEHIIDLQAEPFKVIDAFFEEYGNCVIKGCGVLNWEDGTYHVEAGLVGLQGTDPEGNPTYKVAPFAGMTEVALPAYFVLRFETVERKYVDEKMHPIYYEYRAELVMEKPADESYLEITPSGAVRFLDVTGVTHKLDKDGDGKAVTVSFEEAAERVNVESGDTLSGMWGKVRKWFAALQAVAFSGKTEDLTDDAEHRLTTDTEKARWNDTYTKKETDDKDTEALRMAKEYADNQVSNLGSDVYRKAEVYTKQEADAQHEGDLAAAKKFATDRISELINGSPAALDTLYEIANALNNDPNFATTIMALINGKADTAHKHTKSQITDFPTSMPASDVYPWAKQPNKPSYTYSEVGAAAANHNHDTVYQPKGSYAALNHNHAATDVNEDSTHRFMTDAERTKLNGIEAGANKYVHPSTHSADMISDSTTKVMMTKTERSKLAGLESITTYKATNGYIKFGGIIIQWGYLSLSANSTKTVYFPTTFTNSCLNVQLTIADNTEVDYVAYINSKSSTCFTVWQNGKLSKNAYWLAIGY